MSKPTKTASELQTMVTNLIKQKSYAGKVKPMEPYWHERDTEGANWDLNKFQGFEPDVQEVVALIAADVRALRRKFDIVEASAR